MIVNQRELLAYHSKHYRPDFNPDLFTRRTEDIIEEVKKVITSVCNRGSYFSIKVLNFEVVDEYSRIKDILYRYEEEHKSRNKDKTRENRYDYIDIKTTSFVLLMVTYELSAKDETAVVTVPIAIPMIVNKYYLNLSGSLYLPQFQIVDASTYNNTLTRSKGGKMAKSKAASVVLKTVSLPIRMYQRSLDLLTIDGQVINATYFDLNAFKKTSRAFKYILAEYGYVGTCEFIGLQGIYLFDEAHKPYPDNDNYVFYNKDNARNPNYVAEVGVYIRVPKFLYDNDVVTQNMIVTIFDSTYWLTNFNEIFTIDFWVRSLGADFQSDTIDKGNSILTSFRGLLDIATQENIHLPPEMKENMFCLVKWMVCEFSALRSKDNLNILTKRVRIGEYLAALYAAKLNTGIYRITDIGKRISVDSLKKALVTDPMFLIKQISKCNLVAFKNIVTDCDATEVTKFSVKGQSGLGDNGNTKKFGGKGKPANGGNSNSIPRIYRYAHESYLGVLDLDAASATDPGVTGIICPMAKLYDGFFSEFKEPNQWPETYARLLDEYHRISGIQQAIILKDAVEGNTDPSAAEEVSVLVSISRNLTNQAINLIEQNGINGRICPFINLDADGRVDVEFQC